MINGLDLYNAFQVFWRSKAFYNTSQHSLIHTHIFTHEQQVASLQSAIRNSYTHIYTSMNVAAAIESILGFSILPKDSCRTKEPGIEPPTFWAVDDLYLLRYSQWCHYKVCPAEGCPLFNNHQVKCLLFSALMFGIC